ncbi:hypothetical protein V1512DRAFT_236752 [Lipomyces arxii]|uniref:uncharacterized protein n=1 Tax=Lipomyces arxii TaxID=56418 RepID=UPI0034CFA454
MLQIAKTKTSRVPRPRLLASTMRVARGFGSKFSARATASFGQDVRVDELPAYALKERVNIPRVDAVQKSGKLVILSDLFDKPMEGMAGGDELASRNKFVKSKVHITSLLDALISGGNLARADAILPRAFEYLTPEQFVLLRNDYLAAFVQQEIEEHNSVENSIKWLESSVSRFEGIALDASAYSILISGACRLKQANGRSDVELLMQLYVDRGGSPQDILSDPALFTFRDARQIARRWAIAEKDLPVEFRAESAAFAERDDLIQARDQILTEHGNNTDENGPKVVYKAGVDSLMPVDSHGIKLLRSSLQGVSSSRRPTLPLYASQEHKDVELDEGFLHLESQLRLLPEAEREQYRQAFEAYNMDRQLALETLALESAKEKWKYDYEQAQQRGQVSARNVNGYLWEWHLAMREQVEQELKRIDQVTAKSESRGMAQTDRARVRYGPYFKLVKPEKLSIITIMETMKMNSSTGIIEGMRTTRALAGIGRAIEMEYNSEQLQRADQAKAGFKPKIASQNVVELRRSIAAARRGSSATNVELSWKAEWPDDIKIEIASVLMSIFMQVARIAVAAIDPVTKKKVYALAPVVTHSYQYTGGTKLGVLKLHRDFARKLSSEPASGTLHPQQLPMLVKPKSWTGWNEGGYYYSTTQLMRTKDSAEQLAYIKEACRRHDLTTVYEGLDVLGSAAWIINSRVFEVLAKVWNSGEEFLEIPKQTDGEIEFPPEPPKDAEPTARRDWARRCKLMIHERMANHSQRCDVNYKLEISRAFLGERMYFPHNIDFRGRAYAIPPHLNHLGNDMCRGLLMFWEGKPLGERGLRWLKIHLANVCGYDKADFQSRVDYVDQSLENVFDSADKPLDGKRWWTRAADPWQALAACFELAEALRSEDPFAFRSRLPVHQDGTCNGLQHYAALGGDIEGAKQVNLQPSDKPQDIYTHVSTQVQEKVQADADKGHLIAKMLAGKVSRKIVKQSVMTNVYGVTFVGARAQILRQLKDLTDIPEEYIWQAAAYLTVYVFETVRNLFNGAHLIQDWLGECAKRISKSVPLNVGSDLKAKSSMTSVIWTTPLGLPVVQPYRATVRKQILTQLQSVYISDPNAIYPVNARKQASAFPPNFIHSLDATHMLLSALACGRNGLTFAAVHDSYWTHSADVDKMNAILRDAFVKLHEGNLITRLKEEFEVRYGRYLHYVEIDPVTPQAKAIQQWRRDLRVKLGRAITVKDEIDAESKRQKLLASEDPAEQAAGAAMVTPTSLVEGEDIESMLMRRKKEVRRKEVKKRSDENENVAKTSESVIRVAMGLPAEKSETEMAVGTAGEVDDDVAIEAADVDDMREEGDEAEDEEPLDPVLDKIYYVSIKGVGVFVPLQFPVVPERGSFDVNALKKSLYFFS